MTIHIHAGGTLRTICGLPLLQGDIAWEDAHRATCVPCALPFGTRVPQYGPAWVAHVAAGGTVLDGNLLVGAR